MPSVSLVMVSEDDSISRIIKSILFNMVITWMVHSALPALGLLT